MTDEKQSVTSAEGTEVAVATRTPLPEPPISAQLAVLLSNTDALKEVPFETVEGLMRLDREIREERARMEFSRSFVDVQTEMEPVARKAYNEHTKSHYAKAEHIYNMLRPVLVRHRFSTSVSTKESKVENHIRIILVVRHEAGHSETHELTAPVSEHGIRGTRNMSRLHAGFSTLTSASRHLICQVFGIELVDDDDGNAGGAAFDGAISEEEHAEVMELVAEAGSDPVKLAEHYKVESLAELSQGKLRDIRSLLNARIRRRNKQTKGAESEG